MFNSRTLAVLKREFIAKVFSKGFILMTVLLPLFMFGIIGFQTFVMTFEGKKETRLTIAVEDSTLVESFKTEFDSSIVAKNQEFILTYKTLDSLAFNQYYEKMKPDLLTNQVNGILYITGKTLKDKILSFYSTNPNNNTVTMRFSPAINRVLISNYFRNHNLTGDDIRYARQNVDFTRYRVTKAEGTKEEGFGNLILAFFLTFLLYMSLLIMGSSIMRSVVEEKTNRIVELLLSSVNSYELMTGKIIGTALSGLLQMFIWMLPVMFLSLDILFVLPPKFLVDIKFGIIVLFLINFFIGLITFLGLFASVGAIFDNDQDAQSGVWPITMLVLIPFYITFSLIKDPSNILAEVCSMLPFFSIIIMPARTTLIDIPFWQILLSVVVNLLTLVGVFYVSGKIYRVGILMTGKKPTWAEVARWFKYQF